MASIVYASIMSPSLMSLNFSTLNPHSYPLLTSFTSSLNRFKLLILPSNSIIPSLMTLMFAPLKILLAVCGFLPTYSINHFGNKYVAYLLLKCDKNVAKM